ncbi:phosphohydrolase [Dyadobacter frigoris]|uniref:Phosphohydrolase n=1 Tax=Dyadobacter frigoris TaxID=2576211 RepID=A0A4V6BHE9_9BACT|nr:phosphohydrolase [Dyadobacter frigoris]TKT85993.1 phosphohydrolase [Dyadobacter frigoris]
MSKFKSLMGVDYERYKNHVYRVFLNCTLIDNKKDNEDKYAIAAVLHDVGIWTDHTFDYLYPSIEQARIHLTEIDRTDWIAEISLMIYWHHKMSKYQGTHEHMVETFRKADWIDVSLGLLTFKSDKKKISENRKRFPNLGFHTFLVKESLKNLLKHPTNPLPIFKK